MSAAASPQQALLAENAELRARLAVAEEAQETLRAIYSGEVDALVVHSPDGPRLFTLQGADAESNRFRGEILAQVSDAVIAVDNELRVTYLNASAERQYGVTASEVLGRCLDEIYDFRWIRSEDAVASGAALRETGQWRGDNIHIKRNGESIHVESSVSCLRAGDGTQTGLLAVIRDITERKRAEAALLESEHKYRSIFENSMDAIFLAIPNQRVTAANPAACAIFGMTEEELCRVGRAGIEDPADPRHAVAVEERTRTGRVRYETTHVRKDGTKFPSEVSSVITDGGARSLVILRDVTERKLAEEALAAAHRQTQSIIDNTTGLVYAFDLEGRFVLANAAVAKLLNSTPAQMIGKRRHDFMPQADAEGHEANDRRAIEAGRALDFEEQSELPGRSITWLTTKFPLRDAEGNIYAVGGFSTDITERKRMEEALRRSEKSLALAASGTCIGMFDYNINTDEVLATEQHMKLLGLPTTTTTTTTTTLTQLYHYHEWVRLVHPEDLPSAEATIRQCVAGGQVYESEYRVVWPDGSVHWLALRGVFPQDTSDAPRHMLGISMDITERKHAEQALQEAQAQLQAHAVNLETTVAERTAQLRERTAEREWLQKELLKISEREKLVISQELHDGLCQNLAGTAMMVSILARGLAARGDKDAESAKQICTLLNTSVHEARNLSHGLHPVGPDGEGLMNALTSLAGTVSKLFHLRCTFRCPKPVSLENETASTHLFRIAQEAINNARKHGEADEVRISLSNTAKGIMLTIRDNGVGIPRDLPKKRGMGLKSMGYRAAEIGATLSVQRGSRKGTVVTCTLPARSRSQ